MKSAHRHELETNALAHRLEVYIERYKPYIAKVGLAGLALIALLFAWSYVSGSSAARRGEAWDEYNQAIGSLPPNLDALRHAAEENPGTGMQRMADVTWADGQVYIASRAFIANRAAANDALNKAASAYQGVIASSDNDALTGRARLGLARVYEMQNELEKARAEYDKVIGPFSVYAKAQAKRLAEPNAKETYTWLATAQAPISRAPMGPGTPGQRPEFNPGELSLPNGGAADAGKTDEAKGASETFDTLFKDTQKDSKSNETGDRYKTEQPPAADDKAAADKSSAPADTKSDAALKAGDDKAKQSPSTEGDSKSPK
jgi:hypothetical protein